MQTVKDYMTTPQIMVHDAITSEIVTRDYNADELAQLELDKVSAKAIADAQTAKQVARQAVLDKLGLTADEAQTLFG